MSVPISARTACAVCAHPRDTGHEVDLATERSDVRLDPRVQPVLDRGAVVDPIEHGPGDECVMVAEVAGQCLHEQALLDP
jgi:hypothetical protein